MSHSVLTPTPGLHRLEPNVPKSLGAKITGRNLGAISYLAALFAEDSGEFMSLTSIFGEDGSLLRVYLNALPHEPGDYLILDAESEEIYSLGESDYLLYFNRVDK